MKKPCLKLSFLATLVIVVLAFPVGVSWAVKANKFKEGTGMVYGRVVLPADFKNTIGRIQVVRSGEVYVLPFKKPPRVIFSPVDGYFFAENLKPGSYFIQEVVADFESFYFFPPKIKERKDVTNQYAVEVRPGEVTYMGTFEIYDWKRGVESKLSPHVGAFRFLSAAPNSPPSTLPNFIAGSSSVWALGAGKFNINHSIDSSQQKQALQFIVENSTGSGWDTKIQDQSTASRHGDIR